MRILHVVSSLNVGGAERFVIDLAMEQKNALRLKPTILSMGNKEEPLEAEVSKANISLIHATKLMDLRNIIKAFDVVHIHSSHCLFRLLIVSVFTSTKVVYTRHNERVHTSLKWKMVYWFARFKLHKMIFVAEKAKLNYLKVYPVFTQKAQTILNGVLPMSLHKNPCNKIRISHVGRFVPLKSQHVLIEAVAILPESIQKKIALNFFGTGNLLQKNKDLSRSIIPEVTTHFKGFVTDRNEIYQNTDILAVTSETEGLSLAILESLASGTPVIASNVGGNPELVKDKVNGYLYPYGDVNELAKKILTLSEDASIYSIFSHKSRQIYNQAFSMAHCAEHYLNSYK